MESSTLYGASWGLVISSQDRDQGERTVFKMHARFVKRAEFRELYGDFLFFSPIASGISGFDLPCRLMRILAIIKVEAACCGTSRQKRDTRSGVVADQTALHHFKSIFTSEVGAEAE